MSADKRLAKLIAADEPVVTARDRRGRAWVGTYHFLVRAELVAGDIEAAEKQNASKTVRSTLEAESWPVKCIPGLFDDFGLASPSASYPRRVGEIKGGPASAGLVWWQARLGDAIEAAADHAIRHVFGCSSGDDGVTWHATGVLSPMVLRRNRDRMALAILMPVAVRQPWLVRRWEGKR